MFGTKEETIQIHQDALKRFIMQYAATNGWFSAEDILCANLRCPLATVWNESTAMSEYGHTIDALAELKRDGMIRETITGHGFSIYHAE